MDFPLKHRHQSTAVFEVNHGIESTILRLTQGAPLKRRGFGPLRKLCFIGWYKWPQIPVCVPSHVEWGNEEHPSATCTQTTLIPCRMVPQQPMFDILNSNATPRLSGHFSIFGLVFFVFKSILGIVRQWSRERFAILTLKPWSHVMLWDASEQRKSVHK